MPPYLPPGFRFNPSDLELINNYLLKKVLGEQLPSDAVIEGEVYGDNAQLPEGNGSVEEQYLFVKSKRNQKGTKTTRLAGNGYWKVTGNKKKIFDKSRNHICTKRSLVFKRKSNSKRKKNLLMDEYSLTRSMIQNNSEGWVLCMIKQSNRSPERPYSQEEEEQEEEGDGLTSRPTASPALQGTDNISNSLVIDDMECFDMDDLLASTENNPATAQCPFEPAGGPIHMWPDQPFDQSRALMGTPTLTPTEPPTLGGIDYIWENHDEYSLTRSMIQNNSEEWVLCRIKQSNRSPEMPNSQEEEECEDLTSIDLDDNCKQIKDNHMQQYPVGIPEGPSPASVEIYDKSSVLVINDTKSVDIDDVWKLIEDNNREQCHVETAGEPYFLCLGQSLTMLSSPAVIPTEPQPLAGIDYNMENQEDWAYINMINEIFVNNNFYND